MPQLNCQLAAILITDIIGFATMMQQNEEHAVLIMKCYISVDIPVT